MVTQQSKHGYPPAKINYILQSLKNLQPNKEFDSSAAQLVFQNVPKFILLLGSPVHLFTSYQKQQKKSVVGVEITL